MTALLDPGIADKLARICGMFGSDHDGERAAAAALADRLVRQAGMTWGQILLPKRPPDNIEEMIAFAFDHGDGILDAWQEGFLRGIRGRQFLTKKQLSKLDEIVVAVSRKAA